MMTAVETEAEIAEIETEDHVADKKLNSSHAFFLYLSCNHI